MTEITPADLAAIGDVADWLAEESDSLSAPQAIVMLEAAITAAAKLDVAINLLRSQALRTIEQPIIIGDVVYAKKRTFKRRPDQSLIAAKVADRASLPDEQGEVPTAFLAAALATQMMRDLYVSPSTVPKVGGVQKLGLEMNDVCRDEHTGFELRRTQLEKEKDE